MICPLIKLKLLQGFLGWFRFDSNGAVRLTRHIFAVADFYFLSFRISTHFIFILIPAKDS